MERLLLLQSAPDSPSRRHHYVPKAYLRQWSFDEKRVWTLDTVAHTVKPLGLTDVCVKEDFYRVIGPDGTSHNRVELLFGVVDAELRRVQVLFAELEDPDRLDFDDLIALGVTMAVQRMRTLQQRRLLLQHNRWLAAQNPVDNVLFNDSKGSHEVAGIHTEILFKGMWDSADVLTSRQIEVWHDPHGRFLTCDAPVLVPYIRNIGQSLISAPYVLWPVSPHRVVALTNDLLGEKAVIREASGKQLGLVRTAIEQGRERMIFATADQRSRLPETKRFRRRAQTRLRCSPFRPNGEPIEPPGCCVEWRDAFSTSPDVVLCDSGLHTPAPAMWDYV